ncbi:MAG: hypothetical protein KUG77_25735, partial [Nannocystaceae bacterium]|nr:hypothetical protein [Nannocystaceae bacterium]
MFVPAEVGVALVWLLGEVVAGPASAHASASVELQWTAPADCPPAEAVRREMQGRLDADASLDPSTTVAVVVRVEEDGDGFAAQLEVQAPSGHTTRSLRAARCEVVVDASALIVAMA